MRRMIDLFASVDVLDIDSFISGFFLFFSCLSFVSVGHCLLPSMKTWQADVANVADVVLWGGGRGSRWGTVHFHRSGLKIPTVPARSRQTLFVWVFVVTRKPKQKVSKTST